MSFDAWVVGFGISTLLRQLHLVDSRAAFLVLAAVIAIDVLAALPVLLTRARRSLTEPW